MMKNCTQMDMFEDTEVILTEDISGPGLCRQQRITDTIDVLSHDPDDVFTAFDQFGDLQDKGR